MLGSIGAAHTWQWAAWGKHPVAGDYFGVGQKGPLVKAFFDWVEKGYQSLSTQQHGATNARSWRFWARGPKGETLLCGIGRDSSDRVGRPYPLLIIGIGPLEGWEHQWDLLPLACEQTWGQMEYLSAARFTTFKEFEDGVHVIRPPDATWSEFLTQRGGLGAESGGLEDKVSSLSQKRDFLVPLDGGPSDDPQTLTVLWHALLKTHTSEVPNVVFMGGASDKTYLAVFKRALVPNDFVRLWSVWSESLDRS
jgi:type VI secretion system protein VasJ